MIGEILTVGTELLLGQIVDTNSTYISRRLAEIGIDVFFKSCVGDNPERLQSVLQQALARSDLVVITGGLGPTDDDITAAAVAKALHRDLVRSEEAHSDIVAFFERIGRQPSDNNLKQSMVIDGCTVVRNRVGTAPGQIVEDEGRILVLLPGVPREMTWMMETCVIPHLKKMTGAGDQVIRSLVLRVTGIGESSLVTELDDLLSSQTNPTIAPLASDGLVDLRITAKASGEERAYRMIETVARQIRGRLGVLVYGEDDETLSGIVGRLLSVRRLTVALAESCTGGLLGKLITDVPGSSRYFLGSVVTYSNESKLKLLGVPGQVIERYGAVSRQTAAAMALGVKRLFGPAVSVSVTGLAGPGGETPSKPVGLVYVAVASGSSLSIARMTLSGDRDQIRTRASIAALNLLRRVLLVEDPASGRNALDPQGDLH